MSACLSYFETVGLNSEPCHKNYAFARDTRINSASLFLPAFAPGVHNIRYSVDPIRTYILTRCKFTIVFFVCIYIHIFPVQLARGTGTGKETPQKPSGTRVVANYGRRTVRHRQKVLREARHLRQRFRYLGRRKSGTFV